MLTIVPRISDHTASYRPEVDGLRAIAVVPVLFFHAEVPGFQGGFVGVDIFFVISGYLITRLLLQEMAADRFSFWSFWIRRIRRILPLLLVVTLCTIPLAWMLMSPDGLQNFGQSVVATILSANNILLYLTSGYWQIETAFKPLVHTWSLGVEEQFYLFFPAFLLILWHLPRAVSFTLAILLIGLSLAIAEYWSRTAPEAAFYLLPTRLWELGAGALAALWMSRQESRGNTPPRNASILAIIGLALILLAVVGFGQQTRHPSLLTLIPVCGAVLLILFARPDHVVGRLLASPVFVGIGLLSYGIYLWHQPLISFGRLASSVPLSPAMLVVLALLSIPLAWTSFHLVEQPCRNRRQVGTAKLLSGIIAASVLLGTAGYLLHARGGVPERFFATRSAEMTGTAFASYNDAVRKLQADAFPADSQRNLLVIGNSYARDFVNMVLDTELLDGFEVVYREDMGGCLASNIIPGSTQYLLLRSATMVVFGSPHPKNICPDQDAHLLRQIGVEKVFFLGNKQFGYNPDAFLRLPVDQRKDVRTEPLPEALAFHADLQRMIPGEYFVDLFALIRDEQGKVLVFDETGLLLAGDRSHLTRPGAQFFGKRLAASGIFETQDGP